MSSPEQTASNIRATTVARTWNCDDLLHQLQECYRVISAVEVNRVELDSKIRTAKRIVDDLVVMLTGEAEGRNADERKSSLVKTLNAHQPYQTALRDLDRLTDQRDTLDANKSSQERQARYLEIKIKYNMAMIRLYGGD